jgi:hypothetical protein
MIVIPMAGNSARFYEAGYRRPKYELTVGGESLFSLSVRSFEHYFDTEAFLFVCRRDMDAERFVRSECSAMGLRDARVVSLDGPTRGQGESVLLGLEQGGCASDESLLVFNIDTIRTGYRFPPACEGADGYLEVFLGEGEHWSFVQPAGSGSRRVSRTTEKERISPLCSTGLYYFARAGDFAAACEQALADFETWRARWKELYIAPLYNTLISGGARVDYELIDAGQVRFSGTPQEYRALCSGLPA